MSRPGGRPALPGGDLEDVEARPGVTPGLWLGLALGAARRRKKTTLAVFLAGLAAVAAYFGTRTAYYRVETKILAQRYQALPSFVRPAFQDHPTQSAWETVHRRENLLALIRQTKLLESPSTTPLLAVDGSRSSGQTDPVEALVVALDKRLVVETSEGTITISLDWPDPQLAYDIVQATLQNFLEARHVQEITAIDEVMSVLQGRAAVQKAALDTAVEDAQRHAARPSRAPTPRAHGPSEELVRLQSLLEARQRAIRDVEELRMRRFAELQSRLDQARTTLSDAHPAVIDMRKDLEAASRESPQIEALREEERKVERQYQARLAREGFPGNATVRPPQAAIAPSAEEDPRVRQARIEYEQIMARVNSTLAELDAARAAFKYRYNVIWPPQRPLEPVSPNATKIFGAGFLASLLLALAAAVAPDLLSGRIVQRWQVERSLELPVLGEIRRGP